MTLGNFIAILISAAALYGVVAFIRTRFMHKPTWPLKNVKDL